MLIWILTAVVALVVLATPLRLRREAWFGGIRVGRSVQRIHTFFGLVAVGTWVAFLVWGKDVVLGDALFGIISLSALWITAVAGILLALRWLPTSGPQAEDEVPPTLGQRLMGPVLSTVAHLAVLGIAGYFSWAYVAFEV